MTSKTSFFIGLIGSGIGGSLTPAMHEEEGRRLGLNYVYRRIDLQALGLEPSGAARSARCGGAHGLRRPEHHAIRASRASSPCSMNSMTTPARSARSTRWC